MTEQEFRAIALGLKGATEGAHMGHPDFRADGRIFASLRGDGQRAMVKLTPEQQADFVRRSPAVFSPESGAWGRQGCTAVRLPAADEETVGEALTLARRHNAEQAPASSPRKQTARQAFPRAVVAAIDAAKILGVRAGARSQHRFIGVWPVVIDGRVYARSWSLKPGGWYRTFLTDPLGAIQVGKRTIRVRAVPVRSERIRDAVERAYAEKYPTLGSQKYVRGFRTKRRREATVEFVPPTPARH
jgi:hypothetical protein